MMAELQAARVRPEDVDTAFITHLHMDHIGWNLSRGGRQSQDNVPQGQICLSSG